MPPNEFTFALLESWTCYGTWLPGDERGYVSNTLTDDGYRRKHNEPGTPCDRDDQRTRERATQLQAHATVRLTRDQARCAAQAIVEAAIERDWLILRGAIMANHAHMVVANCPDDGPAVRRVLKGVSQAALSKLAAGPRRWWTRGGSDRYKHGARAVNAAVRYVAEQKHMLVAIVLNEVVEVDSP